MNFTEKLDKLLKDKQMSKPELSKKSGIPYSTIMSYYDENKGTDNIKLSTLKKLSSTLGCSIDYLTDDYLTEEINCDKNSGSLKIPVLGRIPAGIPIEAIEEVISWEEIPRSWTTGNREYFALKLNGDSMEPNYKNGDTVIFLRTNSCDNGNDCAVIINGFDATFKRVINNDDGVILRPINSNYDVQFFSKQELEKTTLNIIGVAKEIRRKI